MGLQPTIYYLKNHMYSFQYYPTDLCTVLSYRIGHNCIQYKYDYDNSGNLLSKTQERADKKTTLLTNKYDVFNRLIGVTTPDSTITYEYDVNDQRSSKTINDKKTYHYLSGENIVYEKFTENNITSEQGYVFGLSIEAATRADGEQIYTTNTHGDVVKFGNDSYNYDAYGQALQEQQDIYNPYKYTGQYCDSETGFYYLRSRYYDPSIGRFTQEDSYHGTTADPSTLNLYNYAGSNPMMYSDSSGHFWETLFDVVSTIWSGYDLITNPSWSTAGNFIWDLGSTILPFIPANYATKTVKIIEKGSDFFDAFKMADKAHDTISRAKKAKKIVDTADTVIDNSKKIKQVTRLQKGKEAADLLAKKIAKENIEKTKKTVAKMQNDAMQNAPKRALSNDALVQKAANYAEKHIGGTGSVAGTLKHSYAEKLLKRYQNIYGGDSLNLKFEASYLDHGKVSRGTKGSIRLDVYDTKTHIAYDYKFVIPKNRGKGLSKSRISQIFKEGPEQLEKVVEINPMN